METRATNHRDTSPRQTPTTTAGWLAIGYGGEKSTPGPPRESKCWRRPRHYRAGTFVVGAGSLSTPKANTVRITLLCWHLSARVGLRFIVRVLIPYDKRGSKTSLPAPAAGKHHASQKPDGCALTLLYSTLRSKFSHTARVLYLSPSLTSNKTPE